jgi:hypothetical protein
MQSSREPSPRRSAPMHPRLWQLWGPYGGLIHNRREFLHIHKASIDSGIKCGLNRRA